MKKAYSLIAFLAILLIAFAYFFGGAVSIVPGWHTTIYPPYYFWLFVAIIILFFAGIGYWLFIKKVSRLNWLLFLLYSLITTVTYFFITFPTAFLTYNPEDEDSLLTIVRVIVHVVPIATWVLIITQLLLVGYVGVLVISKKKQRRF